MTWTGSLFVTCQTFGADAQFKISNVIKGGWLEAYPSSNYILAGNASYDITFNSVSKAITATKRTMACGVVASSSSSSNVSSSSSVSSSSLVSSRSSSSLSSSIRSSSSSSNSSSVMAEGSHHPGEDCLTCHVAGGEASKKIFAYAGTVFKTDGSPQDNAIVKLLNSNRALELRTMTTDASGNFYSMEAVPGIMVIDMHPVVSVGNRSKTMFSAPSTGGCNSCHRPGGPAGGSIKID